MRWSSLTLSFDVRTKHKSSIFCKSWCVPYRESKGNFSEWDNSYDFAWCPSPTEEVLIVKMPIHTVEHAQVEDFKKISLTWQLVHWGRGGGCYWAKPDELTQWLVSEREELLIDTKNSWIEKWRRRRSFLLLFINVVNCFFNPLTLSSVMN